LFLCVQKAKLLDNKKGILSFDINVNIIKLAKCLVLFLCVCFFSFGISQNDENIKSIHGCDINLYVAEWRKYPCFFSFYLVFYAFGSKNKFVIKIISGFFC